MKENRIDYWEIIDDYYTNQDEFIFASTPFTLIDIEECHHIIEKANDEMDGSLFYCKEYNHEGEKYLSFYVSPDDEEDQSYILIMKELASKLRNGREFRIEYCTEYGHQKI